MKKFDWKKTIRQGLQALLLVVIAVVALGLGLRGIAGNPTMDQLNTNLWKDEGPFELSPDRGRFALTYSLIENKSYQFAVPLGRFAAPDIGYANGHFVSLFAPTVSYIIIPGYLLGKMYGLAQVGTFATIAIFGLLNVLLIRAISLKLGAHPMAASLAGLLFLFASPAFAYAVSLYQHHISTFLILMSVYVLLSWPMMLALPIVWLCCGLSISVDNPNLFMMFPIGLYAVITKVFNFQNINEKITINFNFWRALTGVVIILPVAFFMYFNFQSYGDPFKLGGTVEDAPVVDEFGNIDISDLQKKKQEEKEEEAEKISITQQVDPADEKDAIGFFKTRKLPGGFFTHFLSLDRGVIMYTPIMLASVFGFWWLAKHRTPMFQLLLAVMGVNILLYSLWGDPYGGWAFGSRYLIPSYAIAAIGLAFTLSRYRRNFLILIPLTALAGYSVWVNVIGAITSNRNPPQIQILDLESLSGRIERYTYTRNMEMLNEDSSKSFIYREYLDPQLTAWEYAYILMGVIGVGMAIHLLALIIKNDSHALRK
jgi:hypothetical protein